MKSTLTATDRENFWIRVYLGANDDLIDASIKRAYRDFNRTKHKFGKIATPEIHGSLKQSMKYIVEQLLANNFKSQEEFDYWHERSCDYLINSYEATAKYTIHIGQAQKWINMTLKYLFALGEDRIPNITKNYHWFHIPIDNSIQSKLNTRGIKQIDTAWSRIPTYDTYIDYQKRVRELPGIPMDLEFALFNKI